MGGWHLQHAQDKKRGAAPLPGGKLLCNSPTKPTLRFQASREVGSFTAATHGDIFQTLLTAPVRILVTIYRKEKRRLSTLRRLSVV